MAEGDWRAPGARSRCGSPSIAPLACAGRHARKIAGGDTAQRPLPGAMLDDSRVILEQAPWTTPFVGAALPLAVLAIKLLSDGPRDPLDPRLRRVWAGTGTGGSRAGTCQGSLEEHDRAARTAGVAPAGRTRRDGARSMLQEDAIMGAGWFAMLVRSARIVDGEAIPGGYTGSMGHRAGTGRPRGVTFASRPLHQNRYRRALDCPIRL